MKGGYTVTDEQIIEMFFARDEKAVSSASSKYGGVLAALCTNILGNFSDAEECVNDTYVKLWNSIPPARPEKFRAYALRIARNVSFDALKKKKAEKRGSGEMMLVLDELSECVSGKDSVEKEVAAIQLQNDINIFLRILDEEKRNIFICRYWYAYSVKEIAKGFCKKESAVAVILCRTREKLKVFLEERGYEI